MSTVHVNAPDPEAAPVSLLERAVRRTLEEEGREEGEISVTLLPDDEIRAMNREHRGEDRTTDVLAFALHGEDEAPLGDVYVGVEQARRQAREAGVGWAEELVRLAIHGTLHVLGWDHPEGEERDGSPMFRRQEELVGKVLGSARGTS